MRKSPRRVLGVSPRPAYRMPAPNTDLAVRGGLADLLRDGMTWAFQDRPGSLGTFLDPETVERILDGDPGLRTALQNALAAVDSGQDVADRDLKSVVRRMDKVLDDAILPDAIERWDRIKMLMARYLLEKTAYRKLFPDRFRDAGP